MNGPRKQRIKKHGVQKIAETCKSNLLSGYEEKKRMRNTAREGRGVVCNSQEPFRFQSRYMLFIKQIVPNGEQYFIEERTSFIISVSSV